MEMVEVYDEKLQRYLEKDNEVENLLENKINELNNEKKKLSDKFVELKELESSYRDKLTRDSSTDEIRKIADEIDRIKEEVTDIQSNIDSLEIDINKTSETKQKTEKSKETYISNVSKTIEEYEKKLDAINKAIEVCDNESLKEAFKEEQTNMEQKLSELKNQREQELNSAVEESAENGTKKEVIIENNVIKPNFDELTISDLLNKIEIKDEPKDNVEESNEIVYKEDETKQDVPNSVDVESTIIPEFPFDNTKDEENNKTADEQKSELDDTQEGIMTNFVEIPSEVASEEITSEIEKEDKNILPDIDLVNIDVKLPELEDEKNEGKIIIDNMFVDASKISQILGSSGVMPSVYQWLDSNINEDEKVVE